MIMTGDVVVLWWVHPVMVGAWAVICTNTHMQGPLVDLAHTGTLRREIALGTAQLSP